MSSPILPLVFLAITSDRIGEADAARPKPRPRRR